MPAQSRVQAALSHNRAPTGTTPIPVSDDKCGGPERERKRGRERAREPVSRRADSRRDTASRTMGARRRRIRTLLSTTGNSQASHQRGVEDESLCNGGRCGSGAVNVWRRACVRYPAAGWPRYPSRYRPQRGNLSNNREHHLGAAPVMDTNPIIQVKVNWCWRTPCRR